MDFYDFNHRTVGDLPIWIIYTLCPDRLFPKIKPQECIYIRHINNLRIFFRIKQK